MEAKEAAMAARDLLAGFDAAAPTTLADDLRRLWLRALPAGGKDQQELKRDWGVTDPDYEAVGAPVPVLTAIGKEIGKVGRKRVGEFLPLTRHLWDEYGREGRIVAVAALGPMELADPERVVPILYEMTHTCVFWEDCDQLVLKALEPVLRRDPEVWLDRLAPWVRDENKWVRRAGLAAIGRLPMKRAEYTARCVELAAPALGDPDTDVKRALSWALRVSARGEVAPVKQFIRDHQDATDAASLWVLCDVVRSMTRRLLPQFVDLLPIYRAWLDSTAIEPKARRSVQGAIRVLEKAQ